MGGLRFEAPFVQVWALLSGILKHLLYTLYVPVRVPGKAYLRAHIRGHTSITFELGYSATVPN